MFVTPYVPEGHRSSWAQYSIQLKDSQQREELRKHLKEQGIPTMVYYPRGIHQQAAYACIGFEDRFFPHTLDVTQKVLSLPMHPYLTEDEIRKVVQGIKAFL